MFEDKWVVNVDGLADLVVHGVDIGLVNSHTLLGQGGGVVDGYIMQLRMVLPILIWKQKDKQIYVSPVNSPQV